MLSSTFNASFKWVHPVWYFFLRSARASNLAPYCLYSSVGMFATSLQSFKSASSTALGLVFYFYSIIYWISGTSLTILLIWNILNFFLFFLWTTPVNNHEKLSLKRKATEPSAIEMEAPSPPNYEMKSIKLKKVLVYWCWIKFIWICA